MGTLALCIRKPNIANKCTEQEKHCTLLHSLPHILFLVIECSSIVCIFCTYQFATALFVRIVNIVNKDVEMNIRICRNVDVERLGVLISVMVVCNGIVYCYCTV